MDSLIQKITDYVTDQEINSDLAFETAHYDILDTIGCGLMALKFPACTNMMGPVVPQDMLQIGTRVPGTRYKLDPVQGAFNIGCMNRWLDYNDTWLAQEWGHPSDNLAGILAVADYISQLKIINSENPLTMKQVATALIKAHEIQGILALENSFNRVGLDHVLLVKIATSAVVSQMLGGDKKMIANTLSNAWIDGQSLRTYRHAPNTGSRKSWAAGDASSRGVWLAMMCNRGEMGYETALTAKTWGFQDVLFNGKDIQVEKEFGSYVMENILFKISFPAEFHGQTAVECAFKLHPKIKNRLNDIDKIVIHTHESALRIIDKKGELHNPADRDHCIQYMTAIGLLYGELEAIHYENEIANLPEVDELRNKMQLLENKDFSKDYLDIDKRSIANAIEVFFKDGSQLEKVTVEYPIGHRNRRDEAIPLLIEKFKSSLGGFYLKQQEKILETCLSQESFMQMNAVEFMNLFVPEKLLN